MIYLNNKYIIIKFHPLCATNLIFHFKIDTLIKKR